MKVRRFRFYAKREDLQAILEEFQNKFDVYYVPTYSDEVPVFFKDAAHLPDLGTNFFGSHQGNKQILAFSGTTACSWKEYRWKDHGKGGIRYTSLCDENIERIEHIWNTKEEWFVLTNNTQNIYQDTFGESCSSGVK